MTIMPKWAQELTLEACIRLGCELPPIKWRKKRISKWVVALQKRASQKYNIKTHYNSSSSGVCYRDSITITAGKDRRDAKLVLLHELAHWVNQGEHHSHKFWTTAFDLYKWTGLPMRKCLARERTYRKGAIKAYKEVKGGE